MTLLLGIMLIVGLNMDPLWISVLVPVWIGHLFYHGNR